MESALLEQLYLRYAGRLVLYLYSLCGSMPLAQDLLQEVFLKALLSLDESHPNFAGWLYTVGRNLCLNRMRREGRALPAELHEQPDPALGPAARLLQSERSAVLYTAMLRLEGRQRQVLVLQYFGGLPQQEVAQVMGLTHGNVRVIAHRALRRMKQMLEESGYEF